MQFTVLLVLLDLGLLELSLKSSKNGLLRLFAWFSATTTTEKSINEGINGPITYNKALSNSDIQTNSFNNSATNSSKPKVPPRIIRPTYYVEYRNGFEVVIKVTGFPKLHLESELENDSTPIIWKSQQNFKQQSMNETDLQTMFIKTQDFKTQIIESISTQEKYLETVAGLMDNESGIKLSQPTQKYIDNDRNYEIKSCNHFTRQNAVISHNNSLFAESTTNFSDCLTSCYPVDPNVSLMRWKYNERIISEWLEGKFVSSKCILKMNLSIKKQNLNLIIEFLYQNSARIDYEFNKLLTRYYYSIEFPIRPSTTLKLNKQN